MSKYVLLFGKEIKIRKITDKTILQIEQQTPNTVICDQSLRIIRTKKFIVIDETTASEILSVWGSDPKIIRWVNNAK